MSINSFVCFACIFNLFIHCTSPEVKEGKASSTSPAKHRVLPTSEVQWEALNPARGDQSPRAATLWGNRNDRVATGFLAEFKKGFSSPPHIHNVTYRAVVISGLIHNDDPLADTLWMPTASFWTQPKGEAHITAAKDSYNLAYVEIDEGPYLVKPINDKYYSGEHPLNISAQNLVWLDHRNSNLIDSTQLSSMAEIAFLWATQTDKGYLIKLKKGFHGQINSLGENFHAVLIAGEIDYSYSEQKENHHLLPGSYFYSADKFKHTIHSPDTESLLYIRTDGLFKVP